MIAAATILTACVKAPDSVISRPVNNDENSAEEFVGFEYKPITEAGENIELALSKDYGQIILEDAIEVDLSDDIYQINFEQVEGFEEKYEEVYSLFFDEEVWRKQEIANETDENGVTYYRFNNTDDKMMGSVYDFGLTAMVQPSGLDDYFSYEGENIQIYHIDRGENSNDEYELLDGSYSINQAVDYVNAWIDSNYRKYDPMYEFKVKTIIVRKQENRHSFQIMVEKSYKGVPLDNLTMVGDDDGEFSDSQLLFSVSSVSIQMHRVDEISVFTNGNGLIIPKEEKQVDSIITLESALAFCQDQFSTYKEIYINDINLKYTLTPVYTEEDAPQPLGDDTFLRRPYFVAGRIYNSRPMWEFVIDVPPEELVGEGEINVYGDVRKFIYIDAVTGDFFFDFDGVKQ